MKTVGKKEPALGAKEQSSAVTGQAHLVGKGSGLRSLVASPGFVSSVALIREGDLAAPVSSFSLATWKVNAQTKLTLHVLGAPSDCVYPGFTQRSRRL